jgi:hypothetical protein
VGPEAEVVELEGFEVAHKSEPPKKNPGMVSLLFNLLVSISSS